MDFAHLQQLSEAFEQNKARLHQLGELIAGKRRDLAKAKAHVSPGSDLRKLSAAKQREEDAARVLLSAEESLARRQKRLGAVRRARLELEALCREIETPLNSYELEVRTRMGDRAR